MCRVLEVSTSGYYAWRNRPASKRAQEDAVLLRRIRTIHAASRETYGVPRVYKEFVENNESVGRDRIARLMRRACLRGVSPRRFVTTTRRNEATRPAPDLVERRFRAERPNQLWVADITYVPTWAGFLYLAMVLDVFSRKVVGWAMATHLRTELVLDALQMASPHRNSSLSRCCDDPLNPPSTRRSLSASVASSSACAPRREVSATPMTTRWRRASSPRWSASYSTARASRRRPRLAWRCSSGSRAGTTRSGGTRRSATYPRVSSSGVTRKNGGAGAPPPHPRLRLREEEIRKALVSEAVNYPRNPGNPMRSHSRRGSASGSGLVLGVAQ